ncbi:S4 domain-containing protein [Acetobacter indonesiensis]|uniref:S4 domain-containing protein n=1 Tax=Acetobacter indonesiensis TaxID=104101 RepID=UPI0020A49D7E|nr:S4 domain-containing protein [Acetobacter indonesiensis]MCP1231748.1 S4 domain-containing protein [Acetobacter indonesiensis]
MTSHENDHAAGPEGCQANSVRVPLFRLVLNAGWAKTNGEARRVIRGGSVRIDGTEILDENYLVNAGECVSIRQGMVAQDRITLTEDIISTLACGGRAF